METMPPQDPNYLKPAEQLAKAFHERYEELAPQYGYRTREASAVPWEEVPMANKAVMIATAQRLIDDGIIELLPPRSKRAPSWTDQDSMRPTLERVQEEMRQRERKTRPDDPTTKE
jgi:hypothetical protein